MRTSVETVTAWHEAVNGGDIEAAVACCHPEVEVGGPRGTGRGHDLMRGWLRRSGIRLQPQHELTESSPGVVVVEELARWTAENTPFPAPSEPTPTWCVFRVDYGCLVSIVRYEEPPAAMA
ncbi:nuclear transport factor 2 family protein [Ornithinimicrobium cavernae]|uniref:nuclear transport factor 2 family protein n=1 Tax=Ornithinimicrobium cavernae TaxID=2666047 RepID=UPI0012B16567|nr:nuclear transport factor 2 family protein [Ornithinimicrobium cavernae]